MSLYGMMRTGVSGMAGQANRLSTISDNIANSSTNGYKRSKTEFSTLIIPTAPGYYNSGGVTTDIRYEISQQGNLSYTTSVTDLAVNGDGFFVVQDTKGGTYLTRAGSFVPDGQGRFVNAAGYFLMGYDYANGEPSAVANGYGGLDVIQVSDSALTATASTTGEFSANLPSDADIVADADRPSGNTATSAFSAKSSMVVYDNLGSEVMLDVYFTKTADNAWEVAIYNQADAATGGTTPFPYSSAALSTQTLTFDGTTGDLAATSATSISIPVPDGASVSLDLSDVSQLATDYTVFDAQVNGNPPSPIDTIEISEDGTMYALFENGTTRALYKIPLADVQSPDRLSVMPGNVYAESPDSGGVQVGFANQTGRGSIISGAVENANVDIAEELTDMIESQRNYTANSKVFQTGSDLMDILINLKR